MPKLLLVEDNEMNLEILTRRLERKGFQIVIATDGETGIALSRSELPDLILMDMSLPILDGWEATRRICAAPETQHIPIIGLTAHAIAGDREKCLAAGCREYETKPVQFDQLLSKIEALLSAK